MGYFYLTFALFGIVVKGFSGKRLSREINSFRDGVVVNSIRSFICALIGFAVVTVFDGANSLTLTAEGFAISFCSSVFMATFGISWLYAYKNQAYVFLNVITVLCSILTGFLGSLFFGDRLTVWRIIGMAGILLSVCIMSFYNKKIKGKITLKGKLTLLLGGLGLVLSDFMQKVWVNLTESPANAFTFYTYTLALPLQVVLLYFTKKVGKAPVENERFIKKNFVIFLIMSAGLYLNSLMKTLAAIYIDSTVMYPLLQGFNLVVSALLVSLFYKEKPTAVSIVSIILALISLIVMNL